MNSRSPGSALAGLVIVIVGFVALVTAGAWLFSFHGVGQGEVAVVKESGPLDGRGIKEIRQPASAAKPIGAFNKQITFPVTQRDLTEEAGTITVPTADGVNVVVDGQALFQLRTDPAKVEKFYKNFANRKWNGEDISSDQGFLNFEKIRLLPILYQSLRQTLGTYDCTSLNNTCVYVLNADSILAGSGKGTDAAAKKAKSINTSQNLAEAEQKITTALQREFRAGLGDDYFEGVRFQNLRVNFPEQIAAKVQQAQGARADVATARLAAQKAKAEAAGDASKVIEAAKGDKRSNELRAKGIKALAKAYRDNPAQARIDQTKAFCGPSGCDPQAIGTGTFQQLSGAK